MAADESWAKIFDDHKVIDHDFSREPFTIDNKAIKKACQNFTDTGDKEVRLLCKQDSRHDRPQIFQENDLFILPIKNGIYAIIKGEGYIDIPDIDTEILRYKSQLSFSPDTSQVGNSEMQHLDYAYATSLIRRFMGDSTLILTIRGRKFTPKFSFLAGKYQQRLCVKSVQTEIDAGYEGKNNVLLVEAKNSNTNNIIIRQIYYPFRQWQQQTSKPVSLVFFEKREELYCLWQYGFKDTDNYNSITLIKSNRYKIVE